MEVIYWDKYINKWSDKGSDRFKTAFKYFSLATGQPHLIT